MQEHRYRFGEKIRLVRERRGMTMRELAEKAGVSESLVSQIERNRVSPAIDTLMAIIEVLDIDLEFLFADFKREATVTIVRKDDREVIVRPDSRYERLASCDSPGAGGAGSTGPDGHGIEAYCLEIPPGSARGSEEYGHQGRELGVITEGTGMLEIGSREYELKEGDSVSFNSNLPHVLRNSGKKPLRAFWVITPPKG